MWHVLVEHDGSAFFVPDSFITNISPSLPPSCLPSMLYHIFCNLIMVIKVKKVCVCCVCVCVCCVCVCVCVCEGCVTCVCCIQDDVCVYIYDIYRLDCSQLLRCCFKQSIKHISLICIIHTVHREGHKQLNSLQNGLLYCAHYKQAPQLEVGSVSGVRCVKCVPVCVCV